MNKLSTYCYDINHIPHCMQYIWIALIISMSPFGKCPKQNREDFILREQYQTNVEFVCSAKPQHIHY